MATTKTTKATTTKKVTTKETAKDASPKAPKATKAAPKAVKMPEPPAKAFSTTDRNQMISFAAYMRAEKRGFATGNEMNDWLDAEREVENFLATK